MNAAQNRKQSHGMKCDNRRGLKMPFASNEETLVYEHTEAEREQVLEGAR